MVDRSGRLILVGIRILHSRAWFVSEEYVYTCALFFVFVVLAPSLSGVWLSRVERNVDVSVFLFLMVFFVVSRRGC